MMALETSIYSDRAMYEKVVSRNVRMAIRTKPFHRRSTQFTAKPAVTFGALPILEGSMNIILLYVLVPHSQLGYVGILFLQISRGLRTERLGIIRAEGTWLRHTVEKKIQYPVAGGL